MAAAPSIDHVAAVLLAGWEPATRPRVLQAAGGGAWEHARRIAVPADAVAAKALVRGAGPADADVAVEFEWLGHPLVFVGARRARDPGAFEERVVTLAAQDPPDPGAALARLAGGRPEQPAHIELGAANAWRSVGPLRLWARGADAGPPDLATRLAQHPALARCTAPVALAIAFEHPCECWLGVEVSTHRDGAHVVDASQVDVLLERLLGDAT